MQMTDQAGAIIKMSSSKRKKNLLKNDSKHESLSRSNQEWWWEQSEEDKLLNYSTFNTKLDRSFFQSDEHHHPFR